MIRPFTCICLLMAAGSGLYLYQTKHRAQMLDREIARTIKQTEQARDRIGALKGEWALLSEPERLTDLAGQHLSLKTLAPTQFVAMSDLASRLPAPLPPGAMMPQLNEPLALPGAAAMVAARPTPPTPAASPRVAERAPERVNERPVQVAALPQPPATQVAPPPPPPPRAAPHPMPVAVPPAPMPPPHPAPPVPMPMAPRIMAPVMNVSAGAIAQPAPGSIGESVARAARQREQHGGMSTAYAAPLGGSAYAGGGGSYGGVSAPAPMPSPMPSPMVSPMASSALGGVGRVALPAPVPFGASQR